MPTQRFVTGTSIAVSRSHVGYQLDRDNVVDFSVMCRLIGTTVDPDGTTNKDQRQFTIIEVPNTYVLPDVESRWSRDCAVKFDVIRVDYNLSGYENLTQITPRFFGFVAYLEIISVAGGVRETLFTDSFDMGVTAEMYELRDIPAFKAVAGGELYVFVKIYALDPTVSENGICVGNLEVKGTYHYSVADL